MTDLDFEILISVMEYLRKILQSIKTSSAPSSEKTAMVSLQVPESNSTLVILHDYCKQDCTFSDYINYAVGRGQQLLSARPTAAIINKG